jgi:hypothetical protein
MRRPSAAWSTIADFYTAFSEGLLMTALVKSGHSRASAQCPLCPQKRTSAIAVGVPEADKHDGTK